ncbi:LysR family transcriptional regulator [Levilactobacillus brevis]|uniref:LysR family transcriptional regulator n=1 Tax=Levilactobacillus hammesii TaxID=267633 RepID=A0A921F029_9LACO|nr:LysR family transcriptional regulator [Levilactobacillus brevis]HJE86931.1 LysR family transcriptional regulator [Levilactobacillus hammesii]
MQLQDLEIYVNLYQQRSINGVARLMGFAQSNITARLKAIEKEFGVALFTRSYQGLTPTNSGALFYDYAQSVLNATDAVRTRMIATKVQKQHIIMSELLFPLLTAQQERYSLTDNTFELLSSTDMLEISDTRANLVVTYANFKNPAYQEIARNYLNAAFLIDANNDSRTLPLLVNSDHHCPFRMRTLRYAHHDLARVEEINSWDSIISLVKNGKGVALLPEYLIESEGLKHADHQRRFRVPYATYRLI